MPSLATAISRSLVQSRLGSLGRIAPLLGPSSWPPSALYRPAASAAPGPTEPGCGTVSATAVSTSSIRLSRSR